MAKKSKGSGWFNESRRHALASKGIKTAQNPNLNRRITNLAKTETNPFDKSVQTFKLPIETAIYVPSTTEKNKKVSKEEFEKRIADTKRLLQDMYGGFSKVTVEGGYVTDGKVITEPIAKVVGFATPEDFIQNRARLQSFVIEKQRQWKQDSLGYEIEGDLYYVEEKKNGN